MMRFNCLLFVAGVMLVTVCTVYTHNLFGWNSGPVPPGYHLQVLGVVGGGALIAFSILFLITVSEVRLPRLFRRKQ